MLPGLPVSSDRSADIAVVVEPRREVVEIRSDEERAVYVVEPVVVGIGGEVAPTSLADLTDVAATVPTGGQVLTFDGEQWGPASPGDADVSALEARVGELEDRPIVDSPGDIGAQPAGSYQAAGDYATNTALTSGLGGKANSAHGHVVADVAGLQAALNGKQASGDYATVNLLNTGLSARAPQIHTHELGDVNGLAAELATKADADDVTTATGALDTRVDALEARPVVDSPDDIGAQPAGSYATTSALAAGLAGKAAVVHTHAVADTTGLQAALDGKQAAGNYATTTQLSDGLATKSDTGHGHAISGVAGLQSALDGKQASGDYATNTALTSGLAGKSATGHGHVISDTAGLQSALDGKQAATTDLAAIAALAPADGSVLARVAGAWSSRTGAQLKSDLALTKADVGLSNVDNTSDVGKPVSTAAQTALNLKAPIASPTFTGTVTAPRVVHPPVALADAATIATDAALGNSFRVTLAGNRTLGAPTNPADGQRCTWLFTQDGTGSRTITLASGAGGFQFGSDITAFVLSTGAAKSDMLAAEYHAARDRWLVLATAKGY